jgi:LysM repeat protein
MTFRPWLVCCLALLACVAATGCWPTGYSQLDEEKEPHYLTGISRRTEMDYSGAIEAFQKALEVNPRSASAHFEIGLLFERSEQDYAAAIYHFDRFLELRPKSDYADIVKQRILACKQELSKTVSLGPVTQSLQNEFEKLAEENKKLREEVEKWRTQFAARSTPETQSGATPSASARTSTGTAVIAAKTSAATASGPPGVQGVRPNRIGPTASPAIPVSAPSRMHTIKSGETPIGIAKRYGVKVDALMAANPRMDARRLQVGQTINIPQP